MGAGGEKHLDEYLNKLGLTDVEPESDNKPLSKEEAIKKAQDILEREKARKKQSRD